MKLHRFYIEEKINKSDAITLSDRELIDQWRNVLRFQVGREIVLFDGTGTEFHGQIESLTKDTATVSCLKIVENNIYPKTDLTLYISMIKKDKFEWVLQKGTELGVSRFVPIVSERTEKVNVNIERAQKIIREAAEQSGRVTLPTLSEVTPIKEAIDNCETSFFALEQGGETFHSLDLGGSVSFFIGPEGGWADKEKEMFDDKLVSISDSTLRAETASIAVSALVLCR